jgi:hypothetical protein
MKKRSGHVSRELPLPNLSITTLPRGPSNSSSYLHPVLDSLRVPCMFPPAQHPRVKCAWMLLVVLVLLPQPMGDLRTASRTMAPLPTLSPSSATTRSDSSACHPFFALENQASGHKNCLAIPVKTS